MARRVSLPAADDLFRPTGPSGPSAHESDPAVGKPQGKESSAVRAVPDAPDDDATSAQAKAAASGRVRHDEKMTVYVTSDELMAIEQARLTLRGHHKLAVDRGRLVREAVAVVLADLAANGDDSMLVHRLRDDR
ncbi:hypothetical protein BH09ACT12_BH09ACT12_20280 [soil metagenome]